MNFPIPLSPQFQEKAAALGIFPGEISEKMITGSGSGGQKINKTSSCVMLRHLPSGITVKCQKHREQSKNRLSAYKLLILKIEDHIMGKESERAQKAHKLRRQKLRRTRRTKEKLLALKKHRSTLKEQRKPVPGETP